MTDTWDRCVDFLRTRVNEHTLSNWIEPLRCEQVEDTTIQLSAPSAFFVSWIKDNYLELIRECVFEVTGKPYEFRLVSRDEVGPEAILDEVAATTTIEGRPARVTITDEFALKNNLNPRYTFDRFVVGACNQLAHAAAKSVTDNPGGTYNPLFIYGGVGLGKTHLMSAVGYQVLSGYPEKRVYFTTSEEFTNEMINALRFDKMVEFRNKYRKIELLLIDDIQFISGKERTQEEFFHTFNAIYENGHQIVLTSDRVPNEIPDLTSRLRSRFVQGFVADMGAPDLETKVAILRRKANEDSLDLPDDLAYFLASQVDSNIRELLGYLVRVVAMSTLQGLPLTVDLGRTALRDIVNRNAKIITVDDIINHLSRRYNVKVADIKSKKKHKLYSLPRQMGMYLARELTECSYPEIGAAFGGKDHSTVIYAARKIEKAIETDETLRMTVEGLKRDIRG